jgi:hypothetical protein
MQTATNWHSVHLTIRRRDCAHGDFGNEKYVFVTKLAAGRPSGNYANSPGYFRVAGYPTGTTD